MVPYVRTLFDAWVESAYGSDGFWPTNAPAAHFRTSAATGAMLADLVGELLIRDHRIRAVIDLGAGSGELLAELAVRHPDLALTGVDLRPRPVGLDRSIGWLTDRWDVRGGGWTAGRLPRHLTELGRPTMILAVEWLDDLPTPVVVNAAEGWCELLVDGTGQEHPGPAVDGPSRAWVERWWPDGVRAEVGSTRDRAWASVIQALSSVGGSAVMVDYGHLATGRPTGGSLAGYQHGRRVEPRFTGAVNLTAHVAVDAVREAGEAAGARTIRCLRQAELVAELLPPVRHRDPLVDLARRSERVAQTAPGGWGGFWWLQHYLDLPTSFGST